MILTLDMGNSNIVVGGIDENKLYFEERITTDHRKTSLEYAIMLKNILEINKIKRSDIEGAILSSVVPPLNAPLSSAVKKITGKKPMLVGSGMKTGLNIKVDNPNNAITSLSGGNQQKVILGRWLEADADVLLFDNPTQGIDVGTKFEIYHLILNLAKEGKAIIVFSQEFPEIYKVADSCLVLYKGEINASLDRDNLTEMNVMYYSTGANLEGLK